MAGIEGMGTTYNLPNYVGDLFQISPEDTPFLSAIGGLTGGRDAGATRFEWQTTDLRDASATRQRVEGASVDSTERTRSKAYNVVEIHQEAVELSYTRQATKTQVNTGGDTVINIGGVRIPADELQFQVDAQMKQIARDVELSFLTGTFADPANNTNPRRTRGLLEAITTNTESLDVTGGVEVDKFRDAVLDLMQKVGTNGGIHESETRTILTNATGKRLLSAAFISGAGFQETSRNVGGVDLQTFETDFGRVNIMLDRFMPADTLAVVSLEECAPRFLEIPGKGHFFVEPLAKTGASTKVQIYGEIGLEYGNQIHHGKLTLA